jgi:trans-aconitate 2-methyltransferase
VSDWNGKAYDALPLPHQQWGLRTIEALNLNDYDTVLDAGCGTGRDAAIALESLTSGNLICLDQSPGMLKQCSERLGPDPRVQIVEASLNSPFPIPAESVDAVMSVAALHWLPNHSNVWRNIFEVLKSGGRIAIDAGGAGNLDHTLELARQIDPDIRFPHWYYADIKSTEDLLNQAGFVNCEVSLRKHPTTLPDNSTMQEYLKTLVFREWTKTQIEAISKLMIDNTIDYVRLEVRAHKP